MMIVSALLDWPHILKGLVTFLCGELSGFQQGNSLSDYIVHAKMCAG